jgi:glycosyltransferase involved in cell wall biosynthesis
MDVTVVAEQLRRRVPGGIGTYIRGLVQGLNAMHEGAPRVTLWASRSSGAREGDELKRLGRTATSPLPGWALRRAWTAGTDLLGGRPAGDVVHATSLAVPPKKDAPMSVMVHDVAWRRFPNAYPAHGRRWHEAALGRAERRATLLMAPSQTTADDLISAGIDASSIEVVEEGSDHLPAPDERGADEVLDRLGVAGDFVLSVSTLEPRKNLERLVAAFGRADLGDGVSLVVVGPAGWADKAADSAGRGRLQGSAVAFAGAVSDGVLAALYGRSRAVAYVPLLEGFGLPVLEAMRAGTPVVATDVPSAGDAALTVDAGDVDGIAAALRRATTDEALRADLIAAGTKRASELTWERAARRHVELWSELVGRQGARAAS